MIAPLCRAQVAESGLDFVIVRTAKTEGGDPSLAEAGVSITPQGSLTGSSKVTRSQVGFKSPLSNAAVVLSGLLLMRLDCCTPCCVKYTCAKPKTEHMIKCTVLH